MKDTKNTNRVIELFNIVSTGHWESPQRGRIYSVDGIAPSVNCVNGGGQEAKIAEIYGEYDNQEST